MTAPQIPLKHKGSSSTEQNQTPRKKAICKGKTQSSRKSNGQEVDQGTAQGWPKPNTRRKPTRGDSKEASIHHLEGWLPGTRTRLGPAPKQKHTPLKASGVRVGGKEWEQGSTLPRAGAQGSARPEQQPQPSQSVPHPAPVPPPTRRNLAFPGRGRHEWNSPEADCTGYPATEIIHHLASGNRRRPAQPLKGKVNSPPSPPAQTSNAKWPRRRDRPQNPGAEGSLEYTELPINWALLNQRVGKQLRGKAAFKNKKSSFPPCLEPRAILKELCSQTTWVGIPIQTHTNCVT